MYFCANKTPHPQLEIVSDKRDPHARALALEGATADMYNDIFDVDSATSLSCLDLSSPPPLEALINEEKVAVDCIKSFEASITSSFLSPLSIPNPEPQETISSLEMSYVFKIGDALSNMVLRFSIDSLDNF
ncbi:hypothetical protein HAX54_011384 [Datura stramonium]|uniref:Uncharacterized protein n=1 Tax=Datura stramonium TaxID=4076 RepID=A0ABS8TJT4_DATST|nr:hypothetical protein [Datura stramonium]